MRTATRRCVHTSKKWECMLGALNVREAHGLYQYSFNINTQYDKNTYILFTCTRLYLL